MAPLDEIQVGDVVNVPGAMHGTVKFVGVVAGKPGRFAGVELAPEHARRGKNSGDVDGKKYFATSTAGAGIFVPINNNKYVTRRSASNAPPTPSRPINFSKSVGPSSSMSRTPRMRRPSLPRPESPRVSAPPKLSLSGLRTPSTASKAPGSNGYARSPVKAPSRASDRPPSRFSVEDDVSSVRTSDFERNSNGAEIADLKEQVKGLENQLLDRDRQLEEQSNTLGDFQRTMEELEGSDAMSIRAQLREKNDRIAQLTMEFDMHRADFRMTLDTLEVAASETERVYEQRIDELMQQNKELQDRGEDVEAVARQLKQLEELVSELEEGLEDARRGEAEARAEVEFLRGDVERTKLELKKERGSSGVPRENRMSPDAQSHLREVEQKDDEIRGLKAIIHSLSRGDPDLHALQQNGFGPGPRPDHNADHVDDLEERVQEFERVNERKTYRIEELERELQQFQMNGGVRNRASTITQSNAQHKSTGSAGKIPNGHAVNHVHRLSDRTVVPSDWQDEPPEEGHYQAYSSHRRGASDTPHHRLETMHESDGRSEDGGSLWCEICETGGHDILSCTNMFGAETKDKPSDSNERSHNADAMDEQSASEPPASRESPMSSHSNNATSQKTGRDVVLEGLRGVGLTSSMSPVAGKASGPLHVLFPSSPANSSTTSFTCVPKSVHTNLFSQTTPPHPLSAQYHRITSSSPAPLGCSSTTPTVSPNRTGQCGVSPAMATSQPPIRLTSHKNFVYRLVFSTLTGRTVQISQIRPSSPTNPGLAPHEISFLRLLEAVTNGAQMEISYTGTILVYKPGLITGTTPIKVIFTGPGVITSSTPTGDMSVDSVRTAILPLFNQFGIFNNIELRVLQRSNPGPNGRGGGGEVQLIFGHQVRLPKTLHLMNAGRIKRIRGVAYSVGVSVSNNARMIDVARGILNPLVPDTYVFSDVSSAPFVPVHDKNNPSAKKKIGLGFGLSLVAESSTGCLFSADVASPPSGGQPPEDIGKQCAYQLLETISKGGCVSPAAFPIMVGLMTMGSEDVGRLQVGRDIVGDESSVQLARDLVKFGAPGWGLRDASGEDSDMEIIVSVVGRGIGNVGRKVA
ncbi:RNA 3'-terminal phosphate cyclase [Aspergillus cavernicola]|uniref:RNA 3'-terminal phosphate cyclase n=1 Tax=Aspergillus cavernicola TaxID=176166 RepID=A0ABR4IAY8_9EURO